MRNRILAFAALMLFAIPAAWAAGTTLPLLTAGSAISAGDLFLTRQGADTSDKKVTGTQLQTFILGNGFTQFTGPTTSAKTFTLPNASSTLLYSGGALGTPSSGTATNLTGLPLTGLTSQATNTITGNATSGSASPTALAIGSCSTAGSALLWTTNTGFSCNTSITAAAAPVSGLTGAGTGVLTFLATPSSANLASAITDEVGSGAVVFADVPINTQSGDYTLVIGDDGKLIDMTKGTSTTLTIPANASVAFPVGTQIIIRQGGAGQVTVAITSDTLNNPMATLKTRVQYSQFMITKMSSTVWTITGDAAAS